jgi:hypothetical protein
MALKLPEERPGAPVAKFEIVKMELVALKKMAQQAMWGIEFAAAQTSQASGIGQRPGPWPVTWIFRAEFS